MPVYGEGTFPTNPVCCVTPCFPGLNCYSMLKHETLVVTTAALEKIEERLMRFSNRLRYWDPRHEIIGRPIGF